MKMKMMEKRKNYESVDVPEKVNWKIYRMYLIGVRFVGACALFYLAAT